uniref:Clathrin light chain n=1 Tax=Anser brachyrhynchus TaxID=132585 RepID=A0A8B9CGR4_9AVES
MADDFGFFSSSEGAGAEEDPAAAFLAQQESEIAGIENDEGFGPADGEAASATPGQAAPQEPAGFQNGGATVNGDVFQESNGPTDAYAAIAKADRLTQEPESIRKWREEQKKRLEELDAASKVTEQEWREKAKKDLEEWNLRQNEQMEKNRANNRYAEGLGAEAGLSGSGCAARSALLGGRGGSVTAAGLSPAEPAIPPAQGEARARRAALVATAGSRGLPSTCGPRFGSGLGRGAAPRVPAGFSGAVGDAAREDANPPLCFSLSNPLPACLLRALSLSAPRGRIADKAFYQQPDADVIGYVYVPPAGAGRLASATTAPALWLPSQGKGAGGGCRALARSQREDAAARQHQMLKA